MRKEVILAVIIGILLGGVILYGINLANNSSKGSNQSESRENDSTVSQTSSKPDSRESITYPQNNSVVTDTQITLKGSTKPYSNLAIVTESDDILTESDSNGAFSSVINLISGENTVTITVVDENQSTSSASITIIRTATLPQ